MNIFKSIWLHIRKTNLLPPNQVLIPMKDKDQTVDVVKPRRKPKIKEIKIIAKRAEE